MLVNCSCVKTSRAILWRMSLAKSQGMEGRILDGKIWQCNSEANPALGELSWHLRILLGWATCAPNLKAQK